MIAELHWIRPGFLALLPIIWSLCYWLSQRKQDAGGWSQIIAPHLQPQLVSTQHFANRKLHGLLAVLLSLLVIAAAGPAFEKQPQPAYTLKKATVLVMDMSLSMRATDLKPNRLAQARFKALDFTKQLKEGELALVSFAGDAFIISPLTPDHNNISLLLPDLKPEIMPVQGSDLSAALVQADKLLRQAGYLRGDVIVMTDGFASRDFTRLRTELDNYAHRVSFLAFGTADGAPIQLENGELLKDQRGAIVIPKVPFSQLKQLAEVSGGKFVRYSVDNSDLDTLLQLPPLQLADTTTAQSQLDGDQWQDAGVYLVWFTLPLLLLAYKKQLFPLMLLLVLVPKPSQAADWQDLYLSPQQQAKQAYEQGNFQRAQQKFQDPLWQGNSAYRDGRFQEAEALFRQDQSAAGSFNLGNSLAQQQKFAEAISAYEQALAKDANIVGAKENIEALKKLQQQQQQQQQQNDQNSDGQQQQQSPSANGEQNQQNKQQENQQQNQQQADGSEQNSSEEQSEAEQNAKSDSNQNEQGSEQTKQEQKAKQQNADLQKAEQQQQTEQKTGQQKAINEAWPQASPEQSQQLESLMRKVQDDPSVLLRNKMYIEYQKRQHQTIPQGVIEEW